MHEHTFSTDLTVNEGSAGAAQRGVYDWDPRLKFGLFVTMVTLNVVLAIGWLSLLLLLTALALVIWSRIPLRRFAIFFLAPAWATLIIFLGFSVSFGTSPVLSLGPLTMYREGFLMGLSAAARVASDMSWMAILFLTTPFPVVLEVLRWFRVPALLVDTLALAYRYAFLLIEQCQRLREVAQTKGGYRGYLPGIRTTAMITARVFLRAYDRATLIQEAMLARGSDAVIKCVPDQAVEACPNQCDITPIVTDSSQPVLDCRNLSHSYRDRVGSGVRDISFSVPKGEVVVICGPNGAGKTTLLKLLSGILLPQAGEILLAGQRLDRKTRNEAFRHVGILLQDPHDQLFCTNVWEDIAYGPRNLGLPPVEVDRLVHKAMDLMEISHLAERPIHMLSQGEMKRVGLAGLIALRPPLLLLDEPIAGLDPASAKHLVDLIGHLNSHHGYSFVIVTHVIDIAPVIAHRMIVLNNGQMEADGSVREILTDIRLLERCRLEPPVLTKLFQMLKDQSSGDEIVPISLEEAVQLLLDREVPVRPNRVSGLGLCEAVADAPFGISKQASPARAGGF